MCVYYFLVLFRRVNLGSLIYCMPPRNGRLAPPSTSDPHIECDWVLAKTGGRRREAFSEPRFTESGARMDADGASEGTGSALTLMAAVGHLLIPWLTSVTGGPTSVGVDATRREASVAGRLVAYLRVSTAKQGVSGLGLEAQREVIGRHVVGGGLVGEFVEIESGKVNERQQLHGSYSRACGEPGVTRNSHACRFRTSRRRSGSCSTASRMAAA